MSRTIDSPAPAGHDGRFRAGRSATGWGGDSARARGIGALVGLYWTCGLLLWTLLASMAAGAWSRLSWWDLVVLLPIGATAGALVARPAARSWAGIGLDQAGTLARAGIVVSVVLVVLGLVVRRDPGLAWGALAAAVTITLLATALVVALHRRVLAMQAIGAAAVLGAVALGLGVVRISAGVAIATPPLRAFLVLAAVVLAAAPAIAMATATALAAIPDPHEAVQRGARRGDGRRAWVLAGAVLGLAWGVVLRAGMSGLVLVEGQLPSFDGNMTATAILLPAAVTGAGWGWAAHARRHGSMASPRWGASAALAFLVVPLVTVDGVVGMLATGEGVQLVLAPALLVVGGLAMATRRRWPHLLVGTLLGIGAAAMLAQVAGGWSVPSAGDVVVTIGLVGGFGVAFVAGGEPYRPALTGARSAPVVPAGAPPPAQA